MRYLKNSHRSFRVLSLLAATVLVVGVFSAPSRSAEGAKRTKHSSSRQTTQKAACEEARESALKLAELDCMTTAGVITKKEVSGCDCNPMGGKWLCSATVTYQCD